MRILHVFLVAIVFLLSSAATAGAEPMPAPMPAPAPPPAPRIRLPSDGVFIQFYAPRRNDTQRVIVVDAAKERALARYLEETLVLAYRALTEDGSIFQAWDFVTGGLVRFEQVVGSAVDRFAFGRQLLEAHAYLTLALREPAEARRLCATNYPVSMATLTRKTCELLARRASDDE